MPLSDLVDNPADLKANWPTKPLRFHRDPAAFHHLLTLAEVDDHIDSGCLAERNVVLLKDGRVLERYEYADNASDMPRPGAVRTHINNGGSISLRSLQTLKPSIARLHREIRAETGCTTHVNAYLTPPGGQGLKYHYDPYVTLIVQLHGTKAWPLHPPFVTNPVEEYENFRLRGWTDYERRYLANTPPQQTVTLAPGDVFWLPRAWAHSPHTVGDDTSLHLTFALKGRTRQWVAERLARIALDHALADADARAEIPPAELLNDPGRAVEWARLYLRGAMMTMDPDRAAATVRRAALAG